MSSPDRDALGTLTLVSHPPESRSPAHTDVDSVLGRRLIVAIDGPSGSGKSSTARGVAERLGLAFLDTGAMYRAVTWLVLSEGVPTEDRPAVAALTRAAAFDIETDPGCPRIAINGHDVTTAIREPGVSAVVSSIATNLDVRADLIARQRAILERPGPGVVAEGRDITTVVAPDADVRVLLVADPQARVERRHAELGADHSRRCRDRPGDPPRPPTTRRWPRSTSRPGRRAGRLDPSEPRRSHRGDLSAGGTGRTGAMTEPSRTNSPSSRSRPSSRSSADPNVGKSTLVNRIIGRREAVVQDTPGVTRDRVSYDANWNGRHFVVVDTGGWISDATGMAAQIAEQAEMAIAAADAVVFVVDATVGTLDADEAVVRVLRRSQKPVVLAANKVDDQRTEAEAAAMWNLGLGEPYPVSALHGRGSGDLLDAILDALPETPPDRDAAEGGPRRVAIVGKPNVGKSSLLNKLAGQQRVVVHDAAGTTVDPVDELVEVDGAIYRFIDTAGIRRRVKEAIGHEYYASLRTHGAIERAEVCIVVIDA